MSVEENSTNSVLPDADQMIQDMEKAFSKNDGLFDEVPHDTGPHEKRASFNNKRERKPHKWPGIKKGLKVFFLILLLLVLAVCAFVFIKYKPIYDKYNNEAYETVVSSTEDSFKMGGTSYIYDKDDNLLTKLKGSMETVYLSYDEIPQDAVNAFIAIEDKTFWKNKGYDLKGIMRVCVKYALSKGGEVHGASTITQQLVKNVFLTQEVSLERKAKELLMSKYMTEKYTKKDIMEFYINDIYFANGYYGLEAAAQGYFGKKSSELSLSQIAYLCSIPNSPAYYDPLSYPEHAIDRRNLILKSMLEQGLITQDAYNEAVAEKITINHKVSNYNDYAATYAIDCAIKTIMADDGFSFEYSFSDDDEMDDYEEAYSEAYQEASKKLYAGGYKVYTTIDLDAQDTLQNAIDDQLSFDDEKKDDGIYALQGAATVIDNETGKVVAIVGGRSQKELTDSSLNRAFQSYRQPGSTMKPIIVYTPALEKGYDAGTKIKNISISSANDAGYGYDLNNLSGSKYSLRSAVEQSKNGCAYLTFYNIGVDYGLSFLSDLQFAKISESDYSLSASLGGLTHGATTTEMAGAYAAIANYGKFHEVTCIRSMTDPEGNSIFTEYEKQVYDEEASKEMLDILRGVITNGTAKAMDWESDVDAVGKTGTTDDNKDGWFCGSTPYYTISVWVGYDTPRELDSLVGGSYPAYIWQEAMEEYVSDKPAKEFDTSDYANTGNHDSNDSDGSEEYMPGRSDDEVLSDGYTVGDYRKDSEKTAQVENIISQMKALDPNSSSYISDLNTLYNQGLQIIGSMYGIRMTNNAQNELDNAYSELKDKKGEPSSNNNTDETHNRTGVDDTKQETDTTETNAPETEPPVVVEPDKPETTAPAETSIPQETDSFVSVE